MADLTLEDIQREAQRQAITQGLLAAGFGILGARGVNPMQALGQGGLLGLAAHSRAKEDYLHGTMEQYQLAQMQQAMADEAKSRQIGQAWSAQQQPGLLGAQQPEAVPQPPLAFGMQDRGLGMSPVSPGIAPSPRLSANKMSDYQVAIARAKFAEQQGGPSKYIEALYAQAEKLRPEVKETRTVTDPTGQRILVNIYKDGTQEVVPYGPEKKPAHFIDMGGVQMAVDTDTGLPIEGGGKYAKTMTPGEIASNKLGYARLAQEQSQGNKPQLITDNAGNVFAVDPRSAQGVEVTGPGGTPLSKGEKPLSESQGAATAFGMRMKASNDIISEFESKGTYPVYRQQFAAHPATNMMAGEDAQKVHQAKLNWMTASLRKESGAVISPTEFESEDRKYFPQVGDTDAVIEQKRKARALAIEAMAKQAGPGAKNFSGGGNQVLRFDAKGNPIP